MKIFWGLAMNVGEYLGRNRLEGIYVLIIYDISLDASRSSFAKLMEGFGFRVQKSAFEAYLTPGKYEKLLRLIPGCIDPATDSVRVYQLHCSCDIRLFGSNRQIRADDAVII